MSVDSTMLAALDTIYAAAADERLWPDVLRNLLALTESQAASFCVLQGGDQPTLPVFYYLNIETRAVDRDAFMHDYLQGGMAEHDPTVRYIVAHPGQALVQDSAFISEAEKDRHFYYDWHGSHSDTRHRMAGMVNAGPQIQSGVTLHRVRQLGDFHSSQVEQFRALLPHIERAVRIGFQLGILGAVQKATLDVLDANVRGIVFLDRGGRVLFANRAARALAQARDGLLLSQGGVSLQNPADDSRLQQLIGEALAPGSAPLSSTGVMQAHRASGKRPLSVLVSPLSPGDGLADVVRPAVCMVLSDPERQDILLPDALRTLFGLTRSEARLAARLACGDALETAAAALGIGYATARTQLAVIFRKTGTRRQGELIRLLLTGVPSLLS